MNRENDRRRKQILSLIVNTGAPTRIYRADRQLRTEHAKRGKCIDTLVSDAVNQGYSEIIFEKDESFVRQDRQRVLTQLVLLESKNAVAYRHIDPAAEPLLAIPDAIGWAWARGGDWRRRVAPLVQIMDVT